MLKSRIIVTFFSPTALTELFKFENG